MENKELIIQVFDKHKINYNYEYSGYVDDGFNSVEDAINEIIEIKLKEREEIILKELEVIKAAQSVIDLIKRIFNV